MSDEGKIVVVLGNAWIRDRESRDLPGGSVIGKRGPSASLVSLSYNDALEMVSDLDLYGGPEFPELTPRDIRRCAVAALPRLRAALDAVIASSISHRPYGPGLDR